jgi:hypothetical protein
MPGLMAMQLPDFDRVAGEVRTRADALARLDAPLQRALEALRDSVREAFDSEGAAVGASWPPLNSRTLREKRRLGYPAQPLVRTGLLRDGWEVRLEGAGSARSGVLASLAPYARTQQAGMGPLPARPFLPRENAAADLISALFAEHVQQALK